jgi:hypothetical protein
LQKDAGMTFQKAVRVLKKLIITTKPVKVRRVHLIGFDGICEEKTDYFLIKIDKNLTEQHSIDVLLHEVAHVEAWDDDQTHGNAWALSYGRLYRLWEQYIEHI